MGLPSCQYADARDRDGQSGRDDQGKAPPRLCPHGNRRPGTASRLIAALLALLSLAATATAEPFRIATFNTELQRAGPGLLLRDIARGEDPQINGILDTLLAARADIIALQGIDYDLENRALNALADALADRGLNYPIRFARAPNTGMATDLDLDGNGQTNEARDAQGYGEFSGQAGIALLSRWPIATEDVQDFSTLLWRDFPQARLPTHPDGTPFPSAEAQAIQRLSTTAHWVVPIDPPGADRIWVATFHASPPVFDGPEDRNGKRNHDEIAFWTTYLDGHFGPAPTTRLIIAGDANADPARGDSLKDAITTLTRDPRLQDPLSGQPTVLWPDPGPGALRVDYLLPTRDLNVIDQGLIDAGDASRHDLIWLDLQ